MAITQQASADYIAQRYQGRLRPVNWEQCSWKERTVRVMTGVATLGLHAAIGIATTAVVGAVALVGITVIPMLTTPVICCTVSLAPPAIGFASACWTNTLIGCSTGLAIGYLVNRYFAAPPKNAREYSEEWPETTILRGMARRGLLTVAGAALGYYALDAGHSLGLIKTWD